MHNLSTLLPRLSTKFVEIVRSFFAFPLPIGFFRGFTVIRQERYGGQCSRSFYVGDIRPEEVKCKYEFGVLRVTLPKPTARVVESPSHIAID